MNAPSFALGLCVGELIRWAAGRATPDDSLALATSVAILMIWHVIAERRHARDIERIVNEIRAVTR